LVLYLTFSMLIRSVERIGRSKFGNEVGDF